VFTGLVTAVGSIASIMPVNDAVQMIVKVPETFLDCVVLGESIAVNGCCLTVTDFDRSHFTVLLSSETLLMTTFETLPVGASVNCERSLRVGDRLGGHWVTGHVDGQALVRAMVSEDRCRALTIEVPKGFELYIAPKGSITIDGISLTVNWVKGCQFGVMLIEHTLNNTTAHQYAVGTRVNFEVDILSRYVNKANRPVAEEASYVLD
jgi:riboflavin synthase